MLSMANAYSGFVDIHNTMVVRETSVRVVHCTV